MWPMRVSSALLLVGGVRPIQAAQSRAVSKRRASPTAITSAWVISGPTPGICCRRRMRSSLLAHATMRASSSSMLASSYCSTSGLSAQQQRRNGGIAGVDASDQGLEAAQAGAGNACALPASQPRSPLSRPCGKLLTILNAIIRDTTVWRAA
jgi:hypothetical protein